MNTLALQTKKGKIFYFCVLALMLASCAEQNKEIIVSEVPDHLLISNGGVYFRIESEEPYTGKSVKYKDTKLASRSYFEAGLLKRTENFRLNGSLSHTEFFGDQGLLNAIQRFDEDGNDISDQTFVEFRDDGSVKTKGRFVSGMKDGAWKNYDRNGNVITREYFSRNAPLPRLNLSDVQIVDNVPYRIGDNSPYSGLLHIPLDPERRVGWLLQFQDGKPRGAMERKQLDFFGSVSEDFCDFESFDYFDFEAKDRVNWVGELMPGSECVGYNEEGSISYTSRVVDIAGELLDEVHEYYENENLNMKNFLIPTQAENAFFEFELHSEFEFYYENGSIAGRGIYDRGELVSAKRYGEQGEDISNGEGKGISEMTEYLSRGYFANGLPHGRWEDEFGNFKTYENGSLQGPFGDELGPEGVHKDGLREGKYISNFHQDCTNKEGFYLQGEKHGEWREWKYCKERDDPLTVSVYENGVLISEKKGR